MDHQYVDMYLRKKKGYSGSAANAIPVDEPTQSHVNRGSGSGVDMSTVDHQIDRVVRGSFSVQQFVDRTDSLALQVETFEDKILNLTKLVKLSQALQDEKEAELRKQNHELKARLKRQEQITGKLSADFDTLKSQLMTIVRDAVTSATNPIVDDLQVFSRASQDGLAEGERKLQEAKEQLAETLMHEAEAMMSKRLNHLHETSIGVVQTLSTRNQAHIEQLDKRIENIDTHRLSELRRAFEERLNSGIQLARESITSETKSNLHLHLDKIREEFSQAALAQDNTRLRVTSIERQATALDNAFTDFLATFKESTKLHSDKTEELSSSVKEFVSLHEQTRTVVETELESTKQWATRNLHRLKKHIDVINSDLLALRESHVDTTSQLQRVKCHAEAEHEKLLALLQQKSREANILTEIVDKEIQSIHHLTTQHRSHHAATSQSTAVSDSETKHGRIGSNNNLYDELAFTRRPHS